MVNNIDRLVICALYRLSPEVLDELKIVRPQTEIAGIALASARIGAGRRGGRPNTPADISQVYSRHKRRQPDMAASHTDCHLQERRLHP
jgi:hypothetical protein